MGSIRSVTSPATIMSKASTVANIGRSIKNFENISVVFLFLGTDYTDFTVFITLRFRVIQTAEG